MGCTLIVPPISEPVSLAEVKNFCRVDQDEDDNLFSAWIHAARELAEQHTDRQIMTATWRLYLNEFPCYPSYCIKLPKSPLISVESIQYLDTSGVLQTLAADKYQVISGSDPALIIPVYGGEWPAGRCYPDAVQVTFKAGYGSEDQVPKAIKQAILLTVNYWNENRGEDDKIAELPMAAMNLLRRWWVGTY